MRELALFAGAGGGILGGKLLGWSTVCAVEINAYCRSILMQRQNDGILEPFPVWDDVRGWGITQNKDKSRYSGLMRLNTLADTAEFGWRLDPPAMEHVMMWPLGWTDLRPLAMDRFQLWQNLHGKS